MTAREPAWICHRCGYMCDAFDQLDGDGSLPGDGDTSICMNCGARYIREQGRWRPMSTAEYQALEPEAKRDLLRAEWARQRAGLPDLAKKQGGRA